MWSVEDGVLEVDAGTTCAEVEALADPWLFASDRPDETVRAWIDRGGGDLLWGLLGPTRAQVLGVTVELADGSRATFGGRVVKNVAGYDLTRMFCGARGELGEVLEANLRLRPAPRGGRAAMRRDGARVCHFLRLGEPTPDGFQELGIAEARAELRPHWATVPMAAPDRGPLWERIREALCRS